MAAIAKHVAIKTAAVAAAATASNSANAGGIAAMRAELIFYTLLAGGGAVTAEVANAPDITTKALMVLAGTLFGAVAAMFTAQNANPKHRRHRGLVSISAGPIFAYIALAFWPENARFDPREWIAIVAAAAAYFSWMLVRMIHKRQDAIEQEIGRRIDDVAEKAGVPKYRKRRSEDGRTVLRFIGILAGIALLIFACWIGWFFWLVSNVGH